MISLGPIPPEHPILAIIGALDWPTLLFVAIALALVAAGVTAVMLTRLRI